MGAARSVIGVNFWRAVETHRYPDRANASIGVQSQWTNPAQSAWIFSRELWQVRSADERNAYLATMRVPGKLQIHWVVGNVIGPVWLMSQQDDRFVGRDPSQCQLEVGFSFQNVIHPREPKPVPLALNGNGTVSQNWNRVRLEDSSNVCRVRGCIVVPKNRQKP